MKKSDIALALGAALPFLMGGSSKTKLQFSKSEFERFQQGMPIQTAGSAAIDWSKQQFEAFNVSKQERLTRDFVGHLKKMVENVTVMDPDYPVILPYDSGYSINKKMSSYFMFAPGLDMPEGDLLLSPWETKPNPMNNEKANTPARVIRALLGNFTMYGGLDYGTTIPVTDNYYQNIVILGGFYMPMNIALRVYSMISKSLNTKRKTNFAILYGANQQTAVISTDWFDEHIGGEKSMRQDFIQFIHYLCRKNNMFVGYKYGDEIDHLSTIGDLGYLDFNTLDGSMSQVAPQERGELLLRNNVSSVKVRALQGSKGWTTTVTIQGQFNDEVIFPVAFPSYEFY